MEQSFFSRIQSYFDSSYAGRYEAAILSEVGKECPDIIISLFKEYDPEQHEINLEYGYQPGRYADLAICDKETRLPVFLLEIKKEDTPLKGQLEDYADYVKRHKDVQFLYLTKHIPSNADMQKLPKTKRARHMLFSDLLSFLLKKNNIQNDPYGKLYIQFLKENGNMYEKLNEDIVRQLLARFFLQNGDTGEKRFMSKSKLLVDFPNTFHHLFNNMALLNDEIKPLLGGKIFTVDFYIEPEREEVNESIEKTGGDFYVYAYGLITKDKNKNERAYIEYGIQLSIERAKKKIDIDKKSNKARKKKPLLTCKLYGMISIYGNKSEKTNPEKYQKISFPCVSDKKKMVKKLKELLIDVLQKSLNVFEMETNKKGIRKIIDNLKKHSIK